MNRRFILFAMALVAVLALGILPACGDDDDDDDGGSCDAEWVNGSYPVKFTVIEDTRTPAEIGTEAFGQLEIEQDGSEGDAGNEADVYFDPSGSDPKELLFPATICGLQLIGSFTDTVTTSVDCAGQVLIDYNMEVENASTGLISGEFTRTTTWSGTECAQFGIQTGVTYERTEEVEPSIPGK